MKNDNSYGPNPLRKAMDVLVAASPLIAPLAAGPSILYQIFGTWYNGTRISRLEDIADDFGKAIIALGKNKVDKDIFESEEYQLTVVDAVDKAARSKSDNKRQCFKRVLVNLVDNSRARPNWDDVDIYLSMLNDMNDVHINVLGLMAGYWSAGLEVEMSKLSADWDAKYSSTSRDMLRHGLNGLEKLGLIVPGRMKVSNLGTRPTSYLATDLAKAFYDYCVA